MAPVFAAVHGDAIVGTLTTIDRLILSGHLTGLYPRGRFERLLKHEGVLLKDFRKYVLEATAKVKANADEIAAEAGRPHIWLREPMKGKDEFARRIAERDGIQEGLVCVLSTLELRTSFDVEGNHRTHRLEVTRRQRKCVHLYFYYLDREFGLMHVRVQTWFPFQIQVYVNGREWLARQLTAKGIAFQRYENALVQVDDLPAAQQLCLRLARRKWIRWLDAWARRINPLLPRLRPVVGGYYWVVSECEIATDVMWRDRASLERVLPDLLDHGIRAMSADDVMRFLGRPLRLGFQGEVVTDRRTVSLDNRQRPEGTRIKHRVKRNWIKCYDKWSVLRVETVINNPHEFKIRRSVNDGKGRPRVRWMRMRKSVADLWRYIQVGSQANERYLTALAQAPIQGNAVADLDSLCHPRTVKGRSYPRFNPVTEDDCALFRAVLAGEHAITGFRNRDLARRLHPGPASPAQARARCQRISRQIAKLRAHRLIAKVHSSRLYRVTPEGQRLLGAAVRYRDEGLPGRRLAA